MTPVLNVQETAPFHVEGECEPFGSRPENGTT